MTSRSTSRSTKLIRGGCFALGLTLTIFAVLGWRIPRGSGHAGTDVIFAAQPAGEVGVSPTGPFISTTDLEPSGRTGAVAGRFTVTNQTGKPLVVRLRALPDSRELDGLLRVDVKAGAQQLYSGPLGGLRRWTRARVALAVRERRPLTFRIWLPASVRTGYQGQVASIPVELKADPLGVRVG